MNDWDNARKWAEAANRDKNGEWIKRDSYLLSARS